METHPVELDPSESARAHYIVKEYQNALFIVTVLGGLVQSLFQS
jgi:hypothetical protein